MVNANKNKMADVTAMFGKKLGEVFTIKFICGRLDGYIAKGCYFTHDGLFCEDRGPCESMLLDLFTGKAVIRGDK